MKDSHVNELIGKVFHKADADAPALFNRDSSCPTPRTRK